MNIWTQIKQIRYPILVLAIAFIFFCYDIILDLIEGDPDVLIEGLVMVLVSHALYREIIQSKQLKQDLKNQGKQISRLSGDLVQTMDKQFKDWNLTRSEEEIAWMIVKGYSFNEIGSARDIREKTVRHHAANIYAKSNTSNRSEFSAFFLEDLIQGDIETGRMPN